MPSVVTSIDEFLSNSINRAATLGAHKIYKRHRNMIFSFYLATVYQYMYILCENPIQMKSSTIQVEYNKLCQMCWYATPIHLFFFYRKNYSHGMEHKCVCVCVYTLSKSRTHMHIYRFCCKRKYSVDKVLSVTYSGNHESSIRFGRSLR